MENWKLHFWNIKEIHLVITSSQYLIKAVKLRNGWKKNFETGYQFYIGSFSSCYCSCQKRFEISLILQPFVPCLCIFLSPYNEKCERKLIHWLSTDNWKLLSRSIDTLKRSRNLSGKKIYWVSREFCIKNVCHNFSQQ